MSDLLRSYDDAGDIPEGREDFYEDNGEGVMILTTPDGAVEDVSGLKKSVKASRAEVRAAQREAAQSGDKIATLEAELAELRENGAAKRNGDGKANEAEAQSRLDKLNQKHDAALAKVVGERDALSKKMLANTRIAEIAKRVPAGMKAEVAGNILGRLVRTVFDASTGEFTTKVFESASSETPRMSNRPNSTADMTPEEFFQEGGDFETEFGDYIPGSGAAGGGGRSGGGNAGSGASGGGKTVTLAKAEKSDAQAYRRARKAAKDSGGSIVIGD
ncbi:MAG: hypothetical protein GY944_08645 [bacterium]|nr:hypothetical protein [bacterium]